MSLIVSKPTHPYPVKPEKPEKPAPTPPMPLRPYSVSDDIACISCEYSLGTAIVTAFKGIDKNILSELLYEQRKAVQRIADGHLSVSDLDQFEIATYRRTDTVDVIISAVTPPAIEDVDRFERDYRVWQDSVNAHKHYETVLLPAYNEACREYRRLLKPWTEYYEFLNTHNPENITKIERQIRDLQDQLNVIRQLQIDYF